MNSLRLDIPKTGIAWAPAACGELVEGIIDHQAFLVSCPIDLYSKAKVCLHPKDMYPHPIDCGRWPKASRAVSAALKAWQGDMWDATLEIESCIPLGKGMASSTADIGAALAATALALGLVPNPVEMTEVAVKVEPTDSTLFPELTVFDHVRGSFHKHIGKPPPLMVMVFDWGGQIASDNWYGEDSKMLPLLQQQGSLAARALDLVQQGVALGDGKVLAAGATLSAFSHQDILHKPGLESLAQCACGEGALGVTVAHSGTVAGLMFPPMEAGQIARIAGTLSNAFPDIQYLGTYHLIGGGIRW